MNSMPIAFYIHSACADAVSMSVKDDALHGQRADACNGGKYIR